MKTYTAKPDDIKRDWYVVNAAGKTLGRLATEIARRLRGKHNPEYTPPMDTGDYIVVINAKDVRVSGNKRKDKCITTIPAIQAESNQLISKS